VLLRWDRSIQRVDADQLDPEGTELVEYAVESGLVEAAHQDAFAAAGLVVEVVEERAESFPETAADDDPIADGSVCIGLHAGRLAANGVIRHRSQGRFTQGDPPR
jgi:hypothetical protein